MAHIILILGFILSCICSIITMVFMSHESGLGMGIGFICIIFAYKHFLLLYKVLWKRREVSGIIVSIVTMVGIAVGTSIISSLLINIIIGIFSIENLIVLYFIPKVIGSGIVCILYYIGSYFASFFLMKQYNISKEKEETLIEQQNREEQKAKENKRLAAEILKEKINTEQSANDDGGENVEFKATHPDVVLSEMGLYVQPSKNIEEIECDILNILEAASLSPETLQIISRQTNMARRMNILSSDYYSQIDDIIGTDTTSRINAANMIKPLAIQAVVIKQIEECAPVGCNEVNEKKEVVIKTQEEILAEKVDTYKKRIQSLKRIRTLLIVIVTAFVVVNVVVIVSYIKSASEVEEPSDAEIIKAGIDINFAGQEDNVLWWSDNRKNLYIEAASNDPEVQEQMRKNRNKKM